MFSLLCIWKSTPHPVLQSILEVYRTQERFMFKACCIMGDREGNCLVIGRNGN